MENNFSLIQEAIKNRSVITFDYLKKDGNISHRIWNPYVLYMYKDQKWIESMKLDFVQTAWDSSSKDDKPFPSFRWFINITDITNLTILDEIFLEPWHEDYVPDSNRYDNPIKKI